MSDSFDIVGTYKVSSTGRSLKLELNGQLDPVFIGLSELDKVLRKKKPNGTLYTLKEPYYGDEARKKPVYVEVKK